MTQLQQLRAARVVGIPLPDTFKIIDANQITAGTPEVVWTPASGKTIRLLGWYLSTNIQSTIEFQDSATAGTVIAQTPELAALGVHDANLGRGIKLAAANNTLKLDVVANTAVSGMVFGVEE